MQFSNEISAQQRQAFARWAMDLPADELVALLAAWEATPIVDGQVDVASILADMFVRLAVPLEEAEATTRAAFAHPPNWRQALS